MEQERILVVDDDEGLLHLLKMRLSAMGFSVTPCTEGHDAIMAARQESFDIAITDLRLRAEDGLVLTEELLQIQPGLPVIILTAHGSIPNAVEAMQRGAFGYLTKPFDDKELKATIDKALIQLRMTREIRRLKSLVKELYGLENSLQEVRLCNDYFSRWLRLPIRMPPFSSAGETGTGKEVLARVIHSNSRRSKGPFVALNCGAFPKLFLKVNSSATFVARLPAHMVAKQGLFQSANGGTLFLDEIGEISFRCRSNCFGPCRNGKSAKSVPNYRRSRCADYRCNQQGSCELCEEGVIPS